MKEKVIRLDVLTRVLQRAEYIEENESIVDLELDVQTNIVTLYLKADTDKGL